MRKLSITYYNNTHHNFTSIRSLCSSAAAVHLAFPRLELTGMLMQRVLLKYDWCKCEMLIQTTRTPEAVKTLRFIFVELTGSNVVI